ncbi:hypothetical protein M5X06_21965 [Paenibacillus alvei]|uniref:DUF2812 domain-containing protein n=1 Tax=Paenibacillus alvei TaxID=44250 RepID=A0ABT4H2P8_PAEAL|nr:hypothetical protein [Paenibacillus alvei]MCY9763255.1 hypothetical protein [Paenibacillus alvei]MCY9769456.1 hypothetical protein [Paenibacillus alvei]
MSIPGLQISGDVITSKLDYSIRKYIYYEINTTGHEYERGTSFFMGEIRALTTLMGMEWDYEKSGLSYYEYINNLIVRLELDISHLNIRPHLNQKRTQALRYIMILVGIYLTFGVLLHVAQVIFDRIFVIVNTLFPIPLVVILTILFLSAYTTWHKELIIRRKH